MRQNISKLVFWREAILREFSFAILELKPLLGFFQFDLKFEPKSRFFMTKQSTWRIFWKALSTRPRKWIKYFEYEVLTPDGSTFDDGSFVPLIE